MDETEIPKGMINTSVFDDYEVSIVLQFVLQIVRQHVIIRVATEVKSHAF